MLNVSGKEVVLYATLFSNSARYANHFCDPNSQYTNFKLAGSVLNFVSIYALCDMGARNEVFVYCG